MSDPVSSVTQAPRPSRCTACSHPAFNKKFQLASFIDGGDRFCFGMQVGRPF